MHAFTAILSRKPSRRQSLKCGRPDGGTTQGFATDLGGAQSAVGVQGKAKSGTAPLVQRLGATNH